MGHKCFLAQYTIRSKQDYIFRSNRLAEVTGASALIAGAFDRLFQCASEIGLRARRASEGKFSLAGALRAFDGGELQLIELFEGGGNDTVLFDGAQSFRRLNAAFTYAVLRDCPGMVPLCVGIEADAGDYPADYRRLMAEIEREKNRMAPGVTPSVPFAMMDRNSFQPYAEAITLGSGREARKLRLTAENYAKWRCCLENGLVNPHAAHLDDMSTERGEESLLAIVHADGNSMGVKIQRALGERRDYDFCVNEMRRFTRRVAEAFSERGRSAVEKELERIRAEYRGKLRDDASLYAARWVVCDGDDATFICNARWALRLTLAYLRAIPEGFSACAGICVFHSHAPYSRAYELAEDACGSAKRLAHASPGEECWIDFHYLHSGIGGNLEEIRERQGTLDRMARPWRLSAGDARCVELLGKLAQLLRRNGVTRTNIKALGAAWEESRERGRAELQRVYYRARGLREALRDAFNLQVPAEVKEEALLPMIYDLSEVYDLWFAKEDERNG